MGKVFIFGHKSPDTDSICASLVQEKLCKRNGDNNAIAKRLGKVNKETQYVLNYLNIEAPELLESVDEGQEVILVDHNEFGQSVDGIKEAKIISVVDHHRISDFETPDPIYFNGKPYGCTCTILFEEYKKAGHDITKEEAVLMVSAIISDTLLFKSPTCTEKDIKAAKELEKIAEIDLNTYGMDMLKAGTDLSDFSAEELINLDSKAFESNGLKFQVAQVNTACISDVLKDKENIEKEINKFIKENNKGLFVFAITDIINNNSQAIVLGEKVNVAEKAFNQTIKDNILDLPGVVSRKKQIVPVITENS